MPFWITQIPGYARVFQIATKNYFNSSCDAQNCIDPAYRHSTHLHAQSKMQVSENRLCSITSGIVRSFTQEQHTLDTSAVLYWSALPGYPKYPTNSQMALIIYLLVAECSL